MLTVATHRPRNVGTLRAAAILYGDLGTSKAYVIGLAFAATGFSSFWLIALVSLLTILIGINYTVVCRCYPNGGGVYASVRRRSEVMALIGAFFIIADYLVTAALSALSAFYYLGAPDPVLFAALAIALIGILNFFGPRHTGSLALIIAIFAVATLIVLILFSLPYIEVAWHNVQPLKGSLREIWVNFVGVIVALSGIEAIANTTGVMKLNRGTTYKTPSVTHTATRAIIMVIAEVAIFTTFFALITSAISHLEIANGQVNAPENPGVRDYMLRYLANYFVGNALGTHIGTIFAWILSGAIGILLLSAVNTAINGLVAVQYIMAGDGEFPTIFQKVNRFGVPLVALLLAIIIPIFLVVLVDDIEKLANLYAIGFVGAIGTNLAATATDFSLPIKLRERVLMFFSFLIMFAIEITLFIEKEHARYYALCIVGIGLLLRAFARERKAKELKESLQAIKDKAFTKTQPAPAPYTILCAVRRKCLALEKAVEKSLMNGYPLQVVFIKEQSVITEADLTKKWHNDAEAAIVVEFLKKHDPELIHFEYGISDSFEDITAALALRLEVSEVIIERPPKFPPLTRRRTLRKWKKIFPAEIKVTPL